KIIVFDLGGTLMEFVNMPPSWVDYYRQGFVAIAKSLNSNISDSDIDLSAEIMKTYNPRINYREIEYSPELIFEKCLEHWNTDINLDKAIKTFFDSFKLNTIIYNDSIEMLEHLKKQEYKICALTDIPSAMPDEYFRLLIPDLLEHIDYYVSSQSFGYRKPNTHGIELIANKYNIKLSNLIFVGDEEKDKKLAEKIGCLFYLIDRKNKNNSADIHNMDGLKKLIT
ncbi:MAG: HAD family hydrolase, partial [Eubacterium sp.]|nr:HAD family hydrolase [Eubacterium sp.]